MRIYDFLRDYLIYLALFFMFFAALRNICEFTIFTRALDLCHCFREFTMKPLSFLRISLWIYYIFFESTLNQLFLQCKSSIFLANYVWIHNDSRESLFVCSLSYSLSFLQFHLKLTIFFAKSLSYQLYFFLFHFSLRPQYKSSIFIGKLLDIFENPLWIHKLFREFTLSFTTNWVSIDERWNVWNFYELM